ncbi:MAG: tRNA (adenosine(37)-N6)-threonylcarbamoyltransferase complex transferase subunit TsaD, partial [Planctomycetota bacterium]
SAEITRLGATIDDAIGEAFDKAASILELGYPGGPEIERWAGRPGARDRAVDLPVSRLGRDSLDFSFSGLKTSLLYAARGVPGRRGDDGAPVKPPTLDDDRRRDLAASFQRAAVEAVTLKLDRAIRRYPDVRTLLTGGGVVANRRLREELRAFADRHGLELVLPELEHCGDNAAMIAGLGGRWLAEGRRDSLELEAHPAATC